MSHANELARRIVVLQRGAGFLSLELPHELQQRDVGQHIEQHLAAITGILAAAVDPNGRQLSIRFSAASLSTAQVARAVFSALNDLPPAEASSNLSRFDGVKFGHRAKAYTDLASMYEATRSEGFGEEVKRRILTGTYVLSHGYYDAYYLKAQQIRRMIADDFRQAFTQCDVIAGPAAPTVAWEIGAHKDPLADYLADIYTLPASLAGLPGMSLPVGFGNANMPVGLQLIGNYLQEGRLLNAAHRFQQATDWHTRRPAGV